MASAKEVDDWKEVPQAAAPSDGADDWKEVPHEAPEQISQLGTAIANGAQGYTANFADEIGGALASAVTTNPFDPNDHYVDQYDKYRDKIRNYTEEGARQNPKTAIGSQIVGAIASPLNKIAAPIEGAGLLMNAGRTFLGGSAIAAGSADKASDVISAATKGGLTDVALQGVLGVGGKVASALTPESLKQFARDRVLKSATGNAQKFYEDYVGPMANSTADLISSGSKKLGIPAMATFGSRASDLTSKLEAARVVAGKTMNEVHDLIDSAQGGSAISGYDIARKLIKKAREIPTNTQDNLSLRSELVRDAKLAKMQGKLTLNDAKKLQNEFEYQQMSKFADPAKARKANLSEEAYNEAIGDTINNLGTKEQRALYDEATKTYGDVKRVQKFNAKEGAREISNRWMSASDLGLGATGALIGAVQAPDERKGQAILENALLGFGAGVGHKFLRQRGSSMASSVATGLGKISSTAPVRAVIGGAQRLPYTPAANAATQYLFGKDGTEE